MSAENIILVILIIAIICSGAYIYFTSDLFSKPIVLIPNISNTNISSYENQLQFYPNMRYANSTITYNVNSCSPEKSSRITEAIQEIESRTGLVFQITDDAEIDFECNEMITNINEDYFIAGEGGPVKAVNTSKFYVIEQGKVLIYYIQTNCDNYNVEIHELLHALGFDHSNNPQSIMFNVTRCDQVFTEDIIEEIKRLYAIPSLPDLAIEDISAIKQGSMLNFSIEIKNYGLRNADIIYLDIYADGEKFYSYNLGNIEYGEGKEVWGITKLPSKKVSIVNFSLVLNQDLDYSNNIISLEVP